MNNLGRGNWFLMFVVLAIGMVVFVGAVTWVGSNVNYYIYEDMVYSHNLSANITGFGDDITFAIDTDTDINWTNASGSYLVSAASVSEWISIVNSTTGNLIINATFDNQTGFFIVPIQATNTSDDEFAGTNFEFQINATNDIPIFSNLNSIYGFPESSTGSYTINALDEEEHYPLNFDLSFINNCTHASWSGRSAGENCSIFNLTEVSNISTSFVFNPAFNEVGVYWANFSVSDFNGTCPHAYCDSSKYEGNKSSDVYVVKFVVSPVLNINVSNCTGATLVEDVEFNCTVFVTTPGDTDSLTITTDAEFKVGSSAGYNSSWFVPEDSSHTSSDFSYNISFSVTPIKQDVGNLSINLNVVDDTSGTSEYATIDLYVNFTESNVTLDSIINLNGSNALYENSTFSVNATDRDLLILDSTVKGENLNFTSNTSWVTYDSEVTLSSANYTTATFDINHDFALNTLGAGNYSVMINVTDTASPANSDSQVFTIEILNETAPEWNSSLSDPVSLNLTEDTAFSYNVSLNVTDDDSLVFYYENVSEEFCSLNASTFNSTSGIINFTPTDCDVGYHNVTIIASDGNLNVSKQFNFTVSNIADSPVISDLDSSYNSPEGSLKNIPILIRDDDFLIPSAQSSFYDENFTISLTFTNLTVVDALISFEFLFSSIFDEDEVLYSASFTPEGIHVGFYNVTVNVTDASNTSVVDYFTLNVTEVLNSPTIEGIDNQSITIHDVFGITVNGSDDEDDRNGINISYSIANLTIGSPNLTIDNETGVIIFDMDSNSSYSGSWNYNVTVNDSDSSTNSTTFWLYVYGNPSLVSPVTDDIFNLTENVAATLNFTINHSVGDNLTYEFWIDSITCAYQNSSDCTYGNLSYQDLESSFGDGGIFGWSFIPNYTDETYGNLKNLTVSVYPNTTSLNSTQRASITTNFSFKLNVSHTNAPPEVYSSFGSYSSTYGSSSPINISLTSNILDYDYLDSYYLQNVTFIINTSAGSTGITAEGVALSDALSWSGLISDWSLQLYSTTTLTESLTITANDSSDATTSDPFTVTFTEPSTEEVEVEVPSSGGGSTTKLKYFSLKLIAPQDIIISDQNYIDIPFSVQNNGQIDLKGINLTSFVRFNGEFSEDIRISLGDNYISELKFGQSENFSMRIIANTQRSGKYKVTILADVTSPKFSDWAEFFIDLRKTNETEAEQILIFTEQFITENPECLELTEIINEAEQAFSLGEYSNSLQLAARAVEACEDAVSANEQIKYPVAGFVQENFYYISFSTLAIFLLGFIFYIYKRVRFNKYVEDNYI